jgi:hypothetical protein
MHWLRPGRFRQGYAFVFMAVGLGYRFGQRPIEAARLSGVYLDQWTHYRTYPAIRESYLRRFKDLTHLEADWHDRRLGPHHPATRWLPDPVKRFAAQVRRNCTALCEAMNVESVVGRIGF